jgi:antitoxin HicB
MEEVMAPAEYLKLPYGRLVVPESDGSFRAEVLEFPGCLAVGETQAEALASLERAAESWIEAALDQGQNIPEPMENTEYSGKLVVRLPKSLHKRAAQAADREGVSLNSFIITSIAEQVGSRARPTFVYAHPAQATARLNFQVVFGVGGMLSTGPISLRSYGQPLPSQQHSTSEGQQVMIGIPTQSRRGRIHA